uniref:BTB domain-containing protein n=1 Tax=Arcella intermedia TaxID=1963864 RepID=A0A6B2KYG0_9EUKA
MTDDGCLYSWGLGSYGRLGHGDKRNQSQPKLIDSIKNVTNFSVGHYHVLAVDDQGNLFSWGFGKHGALGHGDELSHYRPKKVEGYDNIRFTSVSAGLHYSIALTQDGKIYSWGNGKNGKLGHGNALDLKKPQKIIYSGGISSGSRSPILDKSGSPPPPAGVFYIQVSAGTAHVLALSSTGHIYSWGCGEDGRLGNGDCVDIPYPMKVSCAGGPFVNISAGKRHSIALNEKGKIYIWGNGENGELGLGLHTTKTSQPLQIISIDLFFFVSVSAGESHACALTEDGSIFTWGEGTFGQLGLGVENFKEKNHSIWTPTLVKGFDSVMFVSLSAGKRHSLALTGYSLKQSPLKNFQENLKSLLKSTDFSDIKIVMNSFVFSLHKSILRIRCPVLLEEQNYPDLPVSHKGAYKFFKFVYCGKLPGFHSAIGVVLELIFLGKLFHQKILKDYCLIVLEQNLSLEVIENVIWYALKSKIPSIMKRVSEFLTNNNQEGILQSLCETSKKEQNALGDVGLDWFLKNLNPPSTKKKALPTLTHYGFGQLFNSQIDSDFILRLKIDEEEHNFAVHKAILACRSPFFAGVLRVGMMESKTGAMMVRNPNEEYGITPTALKSLLIYLYDPKVEHILDPVDCLYILSVYGYYGLHEHQALIIHCSYQVRSCIRINNCLEIFRLAHKLRVKPIKDKALAFILSNYETVAPMLVYVPIEIFMEIQVAFNLKLLQKYGPF